MKILQVHNFYQQPGGEDQVFAAEYDLLRSRGHQVTRYQADNDDIPQLSGLRAAFATHWNGQTYRDIRRMVKEQQPDVIHSHNTFPLISPSLYYAAAADRVPVIQTLHNYRLICPGASLFRQGHVCQDCVGSLVPYGAVLHRCYRNSRAASAVTASMLTVHRLAGTWSSKVDIYIALSNFARDSLIRGGLPGGKLVVKPNFLVRTPLRERVTVGTVFLLLVYARKRVFGLCSKRGESSVHHWNSRSPVTVLSSTGDASSPLACKACSGWAASITTK